MAKIVAGAQASRLAKDLTLNGASGTTIPRLVYGTAWKKERTADLVYKALVNGFRGIDTAAQPQHYHEHGVGDGLRRAIQEKVVTRGDVYVQTKFSPPSSQKGSAPYDMDAPLEDKVHQSIRSSLRAFTIEGQEPYLDCVVMHSPLPTLEETMKVWKTLESYVPDKIRNLGISNTGFHYQTSLDVVQALHAEMSIKPAVVQNRFNAPMRYETRLRAFCREHHIVFQSFWTLSGNQFLLKSPPVMTVAQKAGVTPPAAYFALVLGHEWLTVLDGTTDEQHMQDDLEGLEKVGSWAEGEGKDDWDEAKSQFRALIGDR